MEPERAASDVYFPLPRKAVNESSRNKESGFMRMLMRVSIPVEAGNAAAKAGTLGSMVERLVAEVKPEAAYFYADDDGQRCGSIVFDMQDTSQIPAVSEPWFLAFGAKITFRPVMNAQDLAKGAPGIAKAVKEHGKAAKPK
jgi:hypothetical protein